VAITAITLLVYLIELLVPSLTIATIGSRFSYRLDGAIGHGIPPEPPVFAMPWSLTGPDGAPFILTWEIVFDLIPSAIRIAMLGSIEFLLSAVIADGMAEQLTNPPPTTRHDPGCELIGVANIIAPFFGGIPATGAIARTATNIRFGAKSPIFA